jgi:hypothetical protein
VRLIGSVAEPESDPSIEFVPGIGFGASQYLTFDNSVCHRASAGPPLGREIPYSASSAELAVTALNPAGGKGMLICSHQTPFDEVPASVPADANATGN